MIEAENIDEKKVQVNKTEFEWTTENEVHFFHAMIGHKPVGIAKSFHMACILDKFTKATSHDITSEVLWNHLDTMYDMAALHESEPIPFPTEPEDFTLPDDIMELVPKPKEQDRGGGGGESKSSSQKDSSHSKKPSSKSESKKEGSKKKVLSTSKSEHSVGTPLKFTGGKVKSSECPVPASKESSGGKVWKNDSSSGKSSLLSAKHSSKSSSSKVHRTESSESTSSSKLSRTEHTGGKEGKSKHDSSGAKHSSSKTSKSQKSESSRSQKSSSAKGGKTEDILTAGGRHSKESSGGQKRKRVSQDSKPSTPLKKSQ